jgi:hypothetical protein
MDATQADVPTVLYRFFDADDRLLYVGVSLEIAWRWKAHSASQPWWGSTARATMEHFPSRAAALAAERQAIFDERPLWNIAHNSDAARTRSGSRPRRQVQDGRWVSMSRAAALLNVPLSRVRATLFDHPTAIRWWGEGNYREPWGDPTNPELRTARVLELAAELDATEAALDRLSAA